MWDRDQRTVAARQNPHLAHSSQSLGRRSAGDDDVGSSGDRSSNNARVIGFDPGYDGYMLLITTCFTWFAMLFISDACRSDLKVRLGH
jgi:hypothetical protein